MKDYDKILRETPLENNQVEYETYFHLKNFQLNNNYKVDDLDYQVVDRIKQEGFEVLYSNDIEMFWFKSK
jgi:hypothetical protein